MHGATPSATTLHTRLLVLTTSLLLVASLAGCGGGGGGGGASSGVTIHGTVTTGGGAAIVAPGLPPGSVSSSVGTPVEGATVEALDADGRVVASALTDPAGEYALSLRDGTFEVGIRLGTVDAFLPLRGSILVRGSTVDGATIVAGRPTFDIDVPEASGSSIAGTVTDGGTSDPVEGATIRFIDAETGELRHEVMSDATGAWASSALPLGSFLVRLDAPSLPAGTVAPPPVTLAVTATGASPAAIDFVTVPATTLAGTLLTTGGSAPIAPVGPEGIVVPAVVVEAPLTVVDGVSAVVSEVGIGEVARFPLATDGTFTLELRDGSFILTFTGLDSDTVAPIPQHLTVKDGLVHLEGIDVPLNAATQSFQSTAAGVSATLTGSVLLQGAGVATRVLALDPATGGTLASADTTPSGGFTLPLSDGSYDIVITDRLPAGQVRPAPLRVTVEAGADPTRPIKESSGLLDDGVVTLAIADASVNLSGFVFAAADLTQVLPDVRVVARKGGEVVARSVTDLDGAWTLQLPVGTIEVMPILSTVPAGFLPAPPVRLEVAIHNGVAEIVSQDGPIAGLDLALEAGTPNLTGVVRFDFDRSETIEAGEVVSAELTVTRAGTSIEILSAITDPFTGEFSVSLPNGIHEIAIDPKSIPAGAAPPPPVRVAVTNDGVTLADGTSAPVGVVELELIQRKATLPGTVTLDSFGVPVELLLRDAGTGRIVNRMQSRALSGTFAMPLYPGTYTIGINPQTLPAGAVAPPAVPLSVGPTGQINSGSFAAIPSLDFQLSRVSVELIGLVSVLRSGVLLPVEATVQVRDPISGTVLTEAVSDPASGEYILLLGPGTHRLGVDPSDLPPGVVAPAPVRITVTDQIEGPGVLSNTLDLVLDDTRLAGATISGTIFTAGGVDIGIPATIAVHAPLAENLPGSAFLEVTAAEDGSFSFDLSDGTYVAEVLSASLPATAVPPTPVIFSVQGASVIEGDTTVDPLAGVNLPNDGTIHFAIQNAADLGAGITGVVASPSGVELPLVRIVARSGATGLPVAEAQTGIADPSYHLLLPPGSYTLELDPATLPFDPSQLGANLLPPSARSLVILDDGGISVSTEGGAVLPENTDGLHELDFHPVPAEQTLSGSVLDPSGDPIGAAFRLLDLDGHLIAEGFAIEGAFDLPLPAGSFTAELRADSIPHGLVAPAPIALHVTASGIVEWSGTPDDGVIIFPLLETLGTVSGTVLDPGSLPIGVVVTATDILTGALVETTQTVATTGDYTLQLPPGAYRIGPALASIPDGLVAPTGVVVIVDPGTAMEGVDFTLALAGATIRGSVLTGDGVVIPSLVLLKDAASGELVTSVATSPTSGDYILHAPAGAYAISIAADSLPSGTLTPASVPVQVSASGAVLEGDETGAANGVDDGIIRFELVDTAASLTLSGTVVLSNASGIVPIAVPVLIEDALSGDPLASALSDATDGTWSIALPSGLHRVRLANGALPAGFLAPTPVLVEVDATAGTSIQQVSGVPISSTTIDFTLTPAPNTISGTVTEVDGSGGVVGAFATVVQLLTPGGGTVITSAATDALGGFAIAVADGTYLLSIASESLPVGYAAAPPVLVTVNSGLVSESSGLVDDGIVELTVAQSTTAVLGVVVDAAGEPLHCTIRVLDPVSGATALQAPSAGGAGFALDLLDGIHDLVIAPSSLPLNSVPPPPVRIAVDSLATPPVALLAPGSATLESGVITIPLTPITLATAFTVAIEDEVGAPLGGLVEIRDLLGHLLTELWVPSSGSRTVILEDGDYEIGLQPGSAGPAFATPAPLGITVSEGTVTFTGTTAIADPLTFVCNTPLLSGIVFGAVGTTPDPDLLLVDLLLLDEQGELIRTIPLSPIGAAAAYTVDLADGTYRLQLVRAEGIGPNEVILPAHPRTVTVVEGMILNTDDDPSTPEVDIDLVLPPIAATISGNISLDGTPVGAGLLVIAQDPTDGRTIHAIPTDAGGNYALALPTGVHRVTLDPASVATILPQALTPGAVTLSVTAGGTATDLTTGQTGTGFDFLLSSFDPLVDASIRGAVLFRPDAGAAAVAVEGALVQVTDGTGLLLGSAITAADGTYVLHPTDGIGSVTVDLSTASIGLPTLPTTPVLITTLGTSVLENNDLGVDPFDGATLNLSDDGIINFEVRGATALLTGRVQTETGAGIGAGLVVTPATADAIPDDAIIHHTDSSGGFAIPVGPGAFDLRVAPGTLADGLFPPAPIPFTVTTNGIGEADTAGEGNLPNDGVIHPIIESGEAILLGRLVDSSGAPLVAAVRVFTPTSDPAAAPTLVGGVSSDPLTGDFSLPVPGGSHFVEVDAPSLPPTELAPDRVHLFATGGAVEFAAGVELVTDILGTGTGALLRTTPATEAVVGRVIDAAGEPVAATLRVLEVGTGSLVTTVSCDPTDGSYSFLAGEGAFLLTVDAALLPSGLVAPAPVPFWIDGGVLTEGNEIGVDPADGTTPNAVGDGIINFVIESAGAIITGLLRDDEGAPLSAFVTIHAPGTDGAFDALVTGVTADFATGAFSVSLASGVYELGIAAGSVPPGLAVPARIPLSVSGSVVTFGAAANVIAGELVIELSPLTGGVEGLVLDGSGAPVPATVIAERAFGGAFVAAASTDESGLYSLALAAGNYRLRLDPVALPPGLLPPAPLQITVTDQFTTLDWIAPLASGAITGNVLRALNGIDTTAIDCSLIATNIDLDPIACQVVLSSTPATPGAEPIVVAQTFTDPATGAFSLPVGPGSYELRIEESSLPTGLMAPPALSLTLNNGDLSTVGDHELCADGANGERRLLFVTPAVSTLDGVLVDGLGAGVPGVISLRNAADGSFVGGAISAPGTGAFSLPLGELTYELSVEPGSLPLGLLAPVPVTVTAAGGTIAVGDAFGVDWDPMATPPLMITVDAANAAISGTLSSATGAPVQARVVAYDAAGQVIASAPSTLQGDYDLAIRPGTHQVALDPFTVPGGLSAPGMESVTVAPGGTAIVDFVLSPTAIEVTGRTSFSDPITGDTVPLSCFVEIRDSVGGALITGAWTQPDGSGGFAFALPVGEGAFELRVDPASVPAGLLAPLPVDFTVSINAISGAVTITEAPHAGDLDPNDGIIDIDLIAADSEFHGQLRADFGAGFVGTFGVVVLHAAGGGQEMVAEATTSQSGNFSLALADGVYFLTVDPSSLPSGFIAPAPALLVADGGAISVDGASIVTGPASRHFIDLDVASQHLLGEVLDAGTLPLGGALVRQFDAMTGAWINDSFTGPDGRFELPVVDGDFRLEVDPISLPAGLLPPAPTFFGVQGSIATLIDGTTLDLPAADILSLDCRTPVGSVLVELRDELGALRPGEIELTDASGAVVLARAVSLANPVSLPLVAGDHLLRAVAPTLPSGLVAPAPISVTALPNGSTIDGSGSATDGIVTFHLTTPASFVSGAVTFQGAPVIGARISARAEGIEVASVTTGLGGTFELGLIAGEYDLSLTRGLPAGAVAPASRFVAVEEQDQIVDFDLLPADGDITGTITLDGVGVPATVLAMAWDDATGEYLALSAAETTAAGDFVLPLPNGGFILRAELNASAYDPMVDDIIAPLPLESIVASDSTTLDLPHFIRGGGAPGEPISHLLVGEVTAGGLALDATVVLHHLSGTSPVERPVGFHPTRAGAYRIAIAESAIDYRVGILSSELPAQGHIAPSPIDITVDAGTITGIGVTPEGGDFRLDLEVAVEGVIVHGVVTDDLGNPLIGVEVTTTDSSLGTSGPHRTTDASGAYAFLLPAGSWWIDLLGLPAGVVDPLGQALVVTGAGPYSIEIDGVAAVDGTIDWVLPRSHALLTGQLLETIGGGSAPLPGWIVARNGSGVVTEVRTEDGSYALHLPIGALTVTPEPDAFDPTTILPLPLELVVTDTGVILPIEHDFAFLTPESGPPARFVSGVVGGDGQPLEVAIDIHTSTGAYVGTIFTDTTGAWGVNLAAGSYVLSIAPEDVPPGFPGTTSFAIEVTEDGVFGPGAPFGAVSFRLDTIGAAVTGSLIDSAGAPVVGGALIWAPQGEAAPIVAFTDGAGLFEALIPDGSYERIIDPATVPAGQLVPTPVPESFDGTPVALDLQLDAAAGTISGLLEDDLGPVAGRILAYGAELIAFTNTAPDGSYTLALPAGEWTITVELRTGAGGAPAPGPILQPDPIAVSIAPGSILPGIDFFFSDPSIVGAFELPGALLPGLTAAAISGELRIEKQVGGQWLLQSFARSNAAGSAEGEGFLLLLDAGSYRIRVTELEGIPTWIGPRELIVDPSLGITEAGQVLDELLFDVDTITVSGLVTDDAGNPVVGLEVGAFLDDGPVLRQVAADATDGTGAYTVELPSGPLSLEITAGLPGSLLLPDPVEAEVFAAQLIIGGVVVDPPVVDWNLDTAHGNLSGAVTLDGALVPAWVEIYEATTLLMVTEAPGGLYDVNVPAGSFTVIPRIAGSLATILAPDPLLVTIAVTGGIDAISHDFAFSAVTAGSARTLTGAVLADGAPIPGAEVRFIEPGGALSRIATCDASGEFAIALPLGDMIVAVRPSDVPSGHPGIARTHITVEPTRIFGAGVVADHLVFSLDTAGVEVTGAVTNFTGAPVSDAIVVLEPLDGGAAPRFATTGPDGIYGLFVPVGSHAAWVSPDTIPANHVAPPEQAFVASGASVNIDFPLTQATASIGGLLTIAGAPAVGGEVILTSSDGLSAVTHAFVDGQGGYSLPVPAGTWLVFAETTGFDPATTIVPDAQPLSITAGQSLTVDFEWQDAATTPHQPLTIQVFQDGITVEAELELTKERASIGGFIDFFEGTTAFNGVDHELGVALTPGVYRVEVPAAGGAPVVTTPIEVIVDAGGITRDGVPLVNNLLTFDLDPPIVVNGFLVSGTVTDAAGAAIPGVGLEARSLSDGSVTASSTTDLGGNFVLDLPVGAHSIELVSGVPAGLVIPSAVIAEVEQTSGVFTAAFDGVPTVDGVLDFILPTGHGSLNGTILVDGVATDGSILVSSGAQLVLEVPTSGGSFDFLLPAGNFNIIAIVPGLDPTLVLPLPFGLAVADTGSVEATQHTFRFDPVDPVVRPGQGLEGFVSLDGAGEGLPIRVTLASGELVTRLSTPASGLWSTTLPPGAFVVAVEPLSVPVGAQNLSSTSVTVTNGTIDGPGVVEGELGFALATTGSTVSGAVSHQQGTPLPGTVVHYRAESVVGSPTVHGFAITDSTGVSSILLGDGRWEIALDGASLLGSVVAPVEAEVEVAGAPVSLDWNLLEAVGTISGTVTIDGLPAADARVLLSIPDTLSDISVVGVAEDGTFTIGAPTGDLGVRAELEGADLSLLVTPSPVRTTITVGSNEAGVDFPYLSTSGEPVLGGRLIGAGQPGPGEVVLSRESSLIPGSFEVHARLQTRFDGIADGWSLALPDGSYQLFVTEWSGAPLLVGPYAIGVSSGAITVDGSSLVGDFDIDLGADPGGPTLTVTGSVLVAGGVGRSGVVIEARPYDGGPTILSTPTDGAGLYTMELPVGAHEMRIASAIADEVLPLPLQSAVVENAGVLELSIAGVAIPAAAVDWNLGAAHGRLTGAVTVNGAAIDAELLAFEGGVLRTRGHAPGGVIDLVLPEGSLTVLAAPIGLPAGMLPPAPLALAVPNTGGIAAFSGDFEFTPTVPATDPGRTLVGAVTDERFGLFSTLVVTDGTGVNLVAAVLSDDDGEFLVTLGPGNFVLSIEPETIPAGLAGPLSTDLVITTAEVTGEGVMQGAIDFGLTAATTTLDGIITDALGAAAVSQVVLVEAVGGEAEGFSTFAITNTLGQYSLALPDGEYELYLDSSRLPIDQVGPGLLTVTISGSSEILDLTLVAADAEIRGTVTVDGAPVQHLLVMACDVATSTPLGYAFTDAVGAYSFDVPAGTFTVLVEPDGFVDLSTHLIPDPVRVTPASVDQIIDFDFAPVASTSHQVVTGRLLQGGLVVAGEVRLMKETSVGVFDLFAELSTAFDGAEQSFTIPLSEGSYNLEILEAGDAPVTAGPYPLVVGPAGVTFDGQPVTGTIDIVAGP